MAILLKIFWEKSWFFSYDFDIFDDSIGCATKFHAGEISFLSFYLCEVKSFKQNNKNIIFTTIFATFYFKIELWNMPKTPGKMHNYDMVKIDTIVFQIVRGELLKPLQIVSCLKWPRSDRVSIPTTDRSAITSSWSVL